MKIGSETALSGVGLSYLSGDQSKHGPFLTLGLYAVTYEVPTHRVIGSVNDLFCAINDCFGVAFYVLWQVSS
jgi:hypothetical protein